MAPTTRSANSRRKNPAKQSARPSTKQTTVTTTTDARQSKLPRKKEKKELKYGYGNVHSLLVEGWPDWLNYPNSNHWINAFPRRTGYYLLASEARALYDACTVILDHAGTGETLQGCSQVYRLFDMYFPEKISRQTKFLACFERLLMRLYKGIPPKPNCMGEVVALKILLDATELEAQYFPDDWLPGTPIQKQYRLIRNYLLDDDDKMAIQILLGRQYDELYYEDDADDDSFDDSTDECLLIPDPKTYVTSRIKQLPGLDADFSLESKTSKLRYLLPSKWFVAFREEDFENHICKSSDEEILGMVISVEP